MLPLFEAVSIRALIQCAWRWEREGDWDRHIGIDTVKVATLDCKHSLVNNRACVQRLQGLRQA